MIAADPAREKRRDAVRNQEQLLDAAAAVFVELGVHAPVRVVAERAGVGMGTLYRHFPTRADLVVAVYRHQVDAAAEAGSVLLRESSSPPDALHAWVDVFVDFLVTKHGLADVLNGDAEGFAVLHRYFVDRLVPVCAQLLDAAAPQGTSLTAYSLLRGIGNLCIGGPTPEYDPARVAHALADGALLPPRGASAA
ncbi:TetR/AcrR family transcriptional regulator [Agromyces aurantiacus]|uniref:TetR/AcrR family transcriptional regulator n=1 Tax=Agromyces aurantiacus TaxID=165814 RepID=A0ABV9R6Z4_9MICO|nr:TetR/AcrR family transcriptional regulator [Agromyces aurantiacus]MBM7502765.1 AcrR family transcriptional regulator [Agromyces aurantiacus]